MIPALAPIWVSSYPNPLTMKYTNGKRDVDANGSATTIQAIIAIFRGTHRGSFLVCISLAGGERINSVEYVLSHCDVCVRSRAIPKCC